MPTREYLRVVSVLAKMCLNFVGLVVLLQSVIFASGEYFDRCDYKGPIDASRNVIINSPNYPGKYYSGDSCRYTFTAPSFHEIVLQCTINIDKGSACTSEYFLMSSDADPRLKGATQTCGRGNVGIVSDFNTLSFAFISTSQPGSGYGGYFNCTLSVRPQACDCGWSQRGRITQGTAAGYTEFPSMVALFEKTGNTLFCGATIISNRCVITAAHCAKLYSDPRGIYIRAGYSTISSYTVYSKDYNVQRIITHPYYDSSTEANDIALLITDTDIAFSRGVGPICLPLTTSSTFDYESAKVIGFGTTSFGGPTSQQLLKTNVTVITNSACSYQYSTAMKSSQMCAYERGNDACQHDSGGPLILPKVRQYQIGVISFGNGCGGPYPGVYTRITSFNTWIQQNAVGLICNKPI